MQALRCRPIPSIFSRLTSDERERLLSNFWQHVDARPLGCWPWLGYAPEGYGVLSVVARSFPGRQWRVQAHRLSWEIRNGPIPERHVLDHTKCRNPICVNPSHMTPMLPAEHARQPDSRIAALKAQTHCKRGHPFTEKSWHLRRDTKTYIRICRECKNIRRRVGGY